MEVKNSAVAAAISLVALMVAAHGAAAKFYDLSHIIPTFGPKDGDATKADLSKPIMGSQPVAGFGFHTVRIPKSHFKTEFGFFQWAFFYFDEHYTTHLDSTDHYVNNPGTLDVAKATIDRLIAIEKK